MLALSAAIEKFPNRVRLEPDGIWSTRILFYFLGYSEFSNPKGGRRLHRFHIFLNLDSLMKYDFEKDYR